MEKSKLKLYKPGDTDEEVLSVYHNWLEAKAYHQRNYNRCLENWRFYFALDPEMGLGQWPATVVQSMAQQHRQLLTYNFAKVSVDTLAGALAQTPYDPDFIPTADEVNGLTRDIKKAMFSDKELMDWDVTFLENIVHGLVWMSATRIKVSDKYHDLGNIGFETCLPGSVLPDPYWKTWASRDCKRAWKKSWLPVNELLELYPKAEPYVLDAKYHTKQFGDQYGANTGAVPYVSAEGTWGNAYEVVEQYDVIEEKVKSEWVITPDGDVEIPDMPNTDKPGWLNRFVPNWQPEGVFEKDEKKKVCIVRAICPSISHAMVLGKGKTEEQVEALPFHFWSASRHNGQNHSIIDSIKDVQRNINYWGSIIQHKIQTEGGGGAQFVDPAGFKNNQEYLDYCNNSNVPSKRFETKEGLLIDGKGLPAVPINKSPFPSEAYEGINHMINTILPGISKVTPAKLGQPGDTEGMSGRLYEMMKIQSDMQSYTIHSGLKLFYNGVYESYLIQAAQTYANEGIMRRFPINKGRESIALNEPVTLPDGRRGIKNDASKLREMRHKVVISEKQASPTEKRDRVAQLSNLLKNIPPEKQMTRSVVWNKIMTNLDSLDEEDRELLEQADEMEMALAHANIEMQIATAKANTANAAVAGMQAQQATQPPVEGEETDEQSEETPIEEPQAPQEAQI